MVYFSLFEMTEHTYIGKISDKNGVGCHIMIHLVAFVWREDDWGQQQRVCNMPRWYVEKILRGEGGLEI